MLAATSLTKSFHDPGRGTFRAVDGLSLSVSPGEIYGLLGANGAGKTTTLRMLATLLRPDAGEIVIDGVSVRSSPIKARSRLAYVPAEAGLPERLTPREVVTLFARIQGVTKPKSRADALLETLGASHIASTPCGRLSTGQKRRVVLARALVHEPPLLLLDEPTDGLDVQGRAEILALMRRLAGEGRAVLMSSHIMGEVEAVCSRVGVVVAGQKVAEGTLPDLLEQTGTSDLSAAFLALTS
ncbi:MAG: sodium transport system ATP-binding protein [Myxococcota bacterium]